MFNPTVNQIKFELERLTNINYEMVWKYHKVIQKRITNIGKLLEKNNLTELYTIYNKIIDQYNNYCKSEQCVPQNY